MGRKERTRCSANVQALTSARTLSPRMGAGREAVLMVRCWQQGRCGDGSRRKFPFLSVFLVTLALALIFYNVYLFMPLHETKVFASFPVDAKAQLSQLLVNMVLI